MIISTYNQRRNKSTLYRHTATINKSLNVFNKYIRFVHILILDSHIFLLEKKLYLPKYIFIKKFEKKLFFDIKLILVYIRKIILDF